MKWTHDQIPDQTGRTAIVTGANSGIGYETALALADKGAHVVLACRDPERGADAIARIEATRPAGSVELGRLDLSSIDSIRAFATDFTSRHDALHLLINNAGVMMPTKRSLTADGFEIQFGVNHLGHFALTGLLLRTIKRTPGARIVTVSSQAHRMGRIDFEDLHWEHRTYRRAASYGQSKLANLLFTFELQRRLDAANADAVAVAAHPGWTATELQRNTPSFRFLNNFFAMKTPKGALPTLRAAVDPEVGGGDYFGPCGISQMNGFPVRVDTTRRAKSTSDAERLWAESERLTGVHFDALGAA